MEGLGFLVIAFGLVIYCIPSILAYDRKHNNKNVIIIINLFLGWTLLGWILALAWSLSKDTAKE